MNKIKVLYIAGSGRSGSTLLELILGQKDGLFSAGELTSVWERGLSENQLCGCGQKFHDCEFWSAVIKQGFGDATSLDLGQINFLKRSVERFYYVPRMVFPEYFPSYRKRWEKFTSIHRDLYKAIQFVSKARVIIDSSKAPFYGLLLHTIPEIDLSIIHLVRDPRGVAYSWARKKVRPEIWQEEVHMTRLSYFRSAYEWVIQNLSAQLLQLVNKNYLRIRYEDLIAKPKDTLDLVLRQIGEAEDSLKLVGEENSVLLSQNHTSSGNPIRFREGEIHLKKDDEWEKSMSGRSKALVTLITWPLLLFYRYHLFPGN